LSHARRWRALNGEYVERFNRERLVGVVSVTCAICGEEFEHRRIEISATVSEAVAEAFENAKDLPEEVSCVAQSDIAGARYAPPSDARIRQEYRLAA
jgi:hypothetical protein